MPDDHRETTADEEEGWLCWCGNWQEDDFHCEACGGEPPWGCDCSLCDVEPEDEDEWIDSEPEDVEYP